MAGSFLVPLLVGSAGTAATATTAAKAATAGLFGFGKKLTLGGVLSGLGTVGTIFSGLSGFQASRAEEQQIKFQEQAERTRAAQEEANRQARLSQIMNQSMAIRAASGGGFGSASDLAITGFSEEEAKRESDIAALDSTSRLSQLRMQRGQTRMTGRASLLSGVAEGAGRFSSRLEQQYERTRTI